MENKKRNLIIYIIYGMVFSLFIFKMFFYANEVDKIPDSRAQTSYVIYMAENPDKLIPEFENIKMYDRADSFVQDNQKIQEYIKGGNMCYLGHPPLYYKFMQMCGVVRIDEGHIYVNMTKITYINILITSMTMLLILYTGYRMLSEKQAGWALHFVFAVISTCLPLYGYVGSGINNDNFCNLGLAIFFIGLISYFERRLCYRTYVLISIGIFISVFSKLTSGLIVLLVCFFMIAFDVIKNRKAAVVWNKFFAATLPIYLVILTYFLYIYHTYGSFQATYSKLASEQDVRSSSFYVEESLRTVFTFQEDAEHFFKGLLNTWTSTYHSSYAVNRTGILVIPFIIVLIIFLIQAVIGLSKYIRSKYLIEETISTAFAVAMVITIIVQFHKHWNGYLVSGYLGGYQARYYMPCLPVIAYSVCQFLYNCKKKLNGVQIKALHIGIAILGGVMVYSDFFYYIYSYYRL